MKRLLCIIALGVSGLASAGQLEDANALLNAKAYDKAFPIYAKLANAGDVVAQFRLGEMYWYGDGTAPDAQLASAWMQKAATRGHAGANEALAVLKQRAARSADIAYWTSGYKGEDLVSGRFNCTNPVIPEVSATGPEIKAVTKAYTTWQECYNGFVANINTVTAPGKQPIPADVLALMTPREGEQAMGHLGSVYDNVINQANQKAAITASQFEKWQTASEKQVVADNRARQLKWDQVRDANQTYQTLVVPNQKDNRPATTGR